MFVWLRDCEGCFLEGVKLFTRDLFHSLCSAQLVFFFFLCLNKTCVLEKSACKSVFLLGR